jgi:hypothetical protein
MSDPFSFSGPEDDNIPPEWEKTPPWKKDPMLEDLIEIMRPFERDWWEEGSQSHSERQGFLARIDARWRRWKEIAQQRYHASQKQKSINGSELQQDRAQTNQQDRPKHSSGPETPPAPINIYDISKAIANSEIVRFWTPRPEQRAQTEKANQQKSQIEKEQCRERSEAAGFEMAHRTNENRAKTEAEKSKDILAGVIKDKGILPDSEKEKPHRPDKRVLDRFSWFRWLRSHPKARKASGGGGIMLSLLIAKQALDYEISGASKTAAIVFLAAWAVLAFAVYVSNMWDKRRPLMTVAWILAGVALFAVWWGYLPAPPTHTKELENSYIPSQEKVTLISASDLLRLETAMYDFLYPTGTVVGGVTWQPNLVDVRLHLSAGTVALHNLDLEITLNEGLEEMSGMADVKELNGIPCTILPQMFSEVPALSRDRLFGEVITDESGNRVTKPANVTEIISPMYRMQCPYLQNSTLSLIIAAAEIPGETPKPPTGARLRATSVITGPVKPGPRKFPRTVYIKGGFQAQVAANLQTFTVEETLPLQVRRK